MPHAMLMILASIRPPQGQLSSILPFGNGTPHCVPRWNSVALCKKQKNHLTAISQREVTGFYAALVEKDGLKMSIQEFFEETVMERFESDDYTFDVYVTRDGRVKLMDFNPWGAFTLPLLLTWEELEENFEKEGVDSVTHRIVDSQCAVRPALKTAALYDYLDTRPGNGWDQFLRKADEELQRRSQSSEAGA